MPCLPPRRHYIDRCIRAEGVLKDSGTVCLFRLFFPLPSQQEPNASCSLPAFYDGLVKFLNIKGFL